MCYCQSRCLKDPYHVQVYANILSTFETYLFLLHLRKCETNKKLNQYVQKLVFIELSVVAALGVLVMHKSRIRLFSCTYII